jgi:hypothetical protein
MATKNEIDAAVKIVADFAGNPESGIIAELLKDLKKSTEVSVDAVEKRVTDIKETR